VDAPVDAKWIPEPCKNLVMVRVSYFGALLLGIRPLHVATEEQCNDDNQGLYAELGIDCNRASRIQLCRNTLEQRKCEDNDEAVARFTGATDCSAAITMSGCLENKEVGRWCPRSCQLCPITPERAGSLVLVQRFCKKSCALCPGEGQQDCRGEFGAWSDCINCKRQSIYTTLRPAKNGGDACPFPENYTRVQDCCGLGTRWRVVAATSIPSFWEVVQIRFHRQANCNDDPIIVRSSLAVRPGEHNTITSSDEDSNDPARFRHSICIECCTKGNIGPIASGSAPPPYGCESALMPGASRRASWRSDCDPCASYEAWLGFRTAGEREEVRCVVLNQMPIGSESAVRHAPKILQLDRWDGSAWESVAVVKDAQSERVVLKVSKVDQLSFLAWLGGPWPRAAILIVAPIGVLSGLEVARRQGLIGNPCKTPSYSTVANDCSSSSEDGESRPLVRVGE